ncbi:uncharacterized protein PRCAT00004469001 [Priceomyces carsonii]|uniref:uncharacterized protein n=1 Tax=Priceomyces carsonii TaxID=28549 RepID=UPI002EDA9319|nr:unnamed protein product [Priceomyces carsonii]
MTVDTEYFKRAWDHSSEEEISLKQIYAYLFNFFGITEYRVDDILDRNNFVGSQASSKEFIHGQQIKELLSDIERDNGNYGIAVSESLKKPYKALGGFESLRRQISTGNFIDSSQVFSGKIAESHKALEKVDRYASFLAFLSVLRNDSFDICINRFFVARKKKVDDTLEMVAKNLNWRINSHPVDKWVFGGDAEAFFEGDSHEFIEAFKINQAFLRGRDKLGRPIVVIHVKDHFGKNCPERDFEKFICVIIEWVRLELKPIQQGVDKGCILFDMTGFTLKNADLAAVKFLATAFEANYPECLGAIWIHNAPWIFNAVWKVIKGWLDPVVASKIHFTNSCNDLESFIDRQFIPKELGGDDTFVMKYKNPTTEDSFEKPRGEEYRKLLKQRTFLILSYFQATINWLESKTIQESDQLLEIRIKLGIKLASNYVKIDPFIRKRGIFERIGEMGALGY